MFKSGMLNLDKSVLKNRFLSHNACYMKKSLTFSKVFFRFLMFFRLLTFVVAQVDWTLECWFAESLSSCGGKNSPPVREATGYQSKCHDMKICLKYISCIVSIKVP